MAGAQHGIVGDDPINELPETQVPDYDLNREANMARFSKTREFQTLRDVIKGRIVFWQQYIPGPNGTAIAVADLPNEERGWRWLAANEIIRELQSIIDAYEQADTVVKDAAARRKRT